MVGAKEFAIGRKIPGHEPNPIVKSISMPSLKGHEDEFKKFAGSFLDKLDKPISRPINKKKVVPTSRKELRIENELDRFPFFDLFNHNFADRQDEEEMEHEIPDDIMNKITYKVFQNIKEYLNNDTNLPGRRQIKLEIDI